MLLVDHVVVPHRALRRARWGHRQGGCHVRRAAVRLDNHGLRLPPEPRAGDRDRPGRLHQRGTGLPDSAECRDHL
eukprot:6801397-Prymnesium_polylepis.1